MTPQAKDLHGFFITLMVRALLLLSACLCGGCAESQTEINSAMVDKNYLNLHRFNGIESYSVGEGTFHIHQHKKLGAGITFGIADTTPTRTLEDTAELNAKPEATATVYVGTLDEEALVGMEFSIPNAYDETVGDHVTWFYYLSHEDVDNNTIEILARKENRVRFRWNGTTIDPNYYDGSKANVKFEVECWADITWAKTD